MSTKRKSKSSAARTRRRRRKSWAAGPSMLHRIARLHELITAGQRVTAETLARELEVTRRTIKRDIEFMRDCQNVPIAWDATKRTYHYTRPCDLLPGLWLTAQEAVTLMLANRTFAAWAGSPLGQVLNSALKKFGSLVGSTMSFSFDSMSDMVFAPADPPAGDHLHLATLQKAIERCHELRFSYCGPKAPGFTGRTVQPLHLAHVDGQWMLVAHDLDKGAIRHFVLARIREVGSTGRRFKRPRSFNAAEHLRGNLGRFTGEKEHEVRIALDKFAAFYARERPWHRSQVIAERADGGIEITLRLNNLIDVENAVLRWGAHAEALSPPELRASVGVAHATALKRYG